MTRSRSLHGRSAPARLALALAGLPLFPLLACTQVRYTESFAPEGPVDRVVVQADAGTVELVTADGLRVERAIRGPELALSLSHSVQDGTLTLVARCQHLLPCAVDTRVEVPEGVPVEVELGRGEVWATGVARLDLKLGEGTADLDLAGDLVASVGNGDLRARLPGAASGRVGVGDGDIELEVPQGAWTVDAQTTRLRLVDLEPVSDGLGHLELTAPAGSVTVRGVAGVARR